jgi:pimeloyl-ACP methyl ester carboxylesterase
MPPIHSSPLTSVDRRAVLSALSFLALPPLAVAASGSSAIALEAATTGVVLLHGKWQEGAGLAPVTEPLRDAGFLIETPAMPWAGSRRFDRSVVEAYDEIDASAIRLREAGARRIVVGGHSSGGAAALRYAALGRDVAAVVLIAPAPIIESAQFQEWVGGDVARARADRRRRRRQARHLSRLHEHRPCA